MTPMLSYDGVATADLVIEAVFENLELKTHVFRELDAVAKPGAVLASNTSTLDIDLSLPRPAGRRMSSAFISSVRQTSCAVLEVVRGGQTGAEVWRRAGAREALGKVPVVVANCRGFVGNRMMFPYMYEAQFLVEEGATPEQVDRALTDFGMAMGIFAVDDMAGIDVSRGGCARSSDTSKIRPCGGRWWPTSCASSGGTDRRRAAAGTGDEQRKAARPEVVDLIDRRRARPAFRSARSTIARSSSGASTR